MPSPSKGPRLGGGPAHERHILANLATALFEHDSITTTEARAKRVRPLAERLVTFAKRGDLHARRRVMTTVRDKGVVHRLFVEIAPDMAERPGGYTRITKVGFRKGDNAPMAVIEIITEPVEESRKNKAKATKPAKAEVEDKKKAAIELVREPMSAKKATVKEAEGATKRAAKEKAAKAAAVATDAAVPADVEDAVTDVQGDAADTIVEDLIDATPVAATEASALVASELPAGAVAATEDGSAPEGYLVKGNADSGLYHEPDGQWYEATVAEFWFQTGADAEAAGFKKAGSRSE